MKKLLQPLLFIVCALCFAQAAKADTYVSGYYRRNGTYVAPHYRSDANNTKRDNWSTVGNVNPYTGRAGTKTYDSYNNYGNSYSNYGGRSSGYSQIGSFSGNGNSLRRSNRLY